MILLDAKVRFKRSGRYWVRLLVFDTVTAMRRYASRKSPAWKKPNYYGGCLHIESAPAGKVSEIVLAKPYLTMEIIAHECGHAEPQHACPVGNRRLER